MIFLFSPSYRSPSPSYRSPSAVSQFFHLIKYCARFCQSQILQQVHGFWRFVRGWNCSSYNAPPLWQSAMPTSTSKARTFLHRGHSLHCLVTIYYAACHFFPRLFHYFNCYLLPPLLLPLPALSLPLFPPRTTMFSFLVALAWPREVGKANLRIEPTWSSPLAIPGNQAAHWDSYDSDYRVRRQSDMLLQGMPDHQAKNI